MEDLYSFQKSKSVFYTSLKIIINNNTIDETNFENKIIEYKNSKNIYGLKSKILKLLIMKYKSKLLWQKKLLLKIEAEELTGKFEKIFENERLNEYYLMKSPT